MRTVFVLLLITISSFLHAQFWTKVGETLGEIQDSTLDYIQNSAETTSQWWNKEGENCFNKAKEEVAKSFKATASYMKQATAELNTGYTEYWEKNGTPEGERAVFDDAFFEGFIEWWDEHGKIYFDYVIDGYKHFIENFEEYKDAYYNRN